MTATAQVSTEDVQIPRHGRGDARLDAYLARPAGPGPHPAVVVIHELYGLNDNIRDIARRFAGEGYAALAVDLFSGRRSRHLCMLSVFTAIFARPLNNQGVRDLRQSIDWLQQRPEVDGSRVGAIGFCMGGGYALALACVESDLRASSAYYCVNPRPKSALRRACPIVGSYAKRDLFAWSGCKLDDVLDQYDVPHDIEVYRGTRHSFFNDTSGNYHPEAAEHSWQRTLAFFREQMG
jgi:carboxymethylenebutenolidase